VSKLKPEDPFVSEPEVGVDGAVSSMPSNIARLALLISPRRTALTADLC
jgi:hypothetical protein